MSEYFEENIIEPDNISGIIKNRENNYSIPYEPYFIFLFESYNVKYKIENTMINFECESLQSLEEFIINNGKDGKLCYNDIIKLIYDTGILIKNLEEDKRGIFCFSLKDYVVVNNNFFLFTNIFKLSNIYKKNLTLKIPINVDENFIDYSLNFSHLPIKQSYKNSYYSFGLMVFFLLTEERYSTKNKHLLNQIYNTPLYFFLLRCLNANPEERYYLYI